MKFVWAGSTTKVTPLNSRVDLIIKTVNSNVTCLPT